MIKKSTLRLLAVMLLILPLLMTSCKKDKDDEPEKPTPVNPKPEPEPNPENNPETEVADYTIIFYGHGGGNLDCAILDNISQFYEADAEAKKKVKVAIQFKFSPTDCLLEPESNNLSYLDSLGETFGFNSTEYAQKYGSATFRYILDPTQNSEDDFYENLATNLDGSLLEDKNYAISNPQNLSDYIKWAAEQCPAKKYILILSSHGGGYNPYEDKPVNSLTKGLLYDYGYPAQGLYPPHLSANTLVDAINESGIKPEIIYCDACLMNSVEYWFELKDVANYLILSSFCVPGSGGDYTTLVDQLATTDIETALSSYCDATIATWDEENYKYSDMTIARTSGFDNFGKACKKLTDKLIDAYQNGGEEVKKAMDEVTGGLVLKVSDQHPLYSFLTYAANMQDAAPEYITESLADELVSTYEDCIVNTVASAELTANDWEIPCTVMLGSNNHFSICQWDEPKEEGEEYTLIYRFEMNADGTLVIYDDQDEVISEGLWGSTFDDTYKKLKFDQATGWSRWIEINQQEPQLESQASFDIDIIEFSGNE